MSEWKKVKFLDYIELNPKVSIAKGEVCPFIEMANVDCNMRQPRCFEYKPFTSGVKFQTYDTVIARIEPCLQNGKGFLFTKQTIGFGSTEYLVFRAKPGKATPLFVYYFMRTHKIKTLMCNSMSGATGRQRVNNDVFLNLEVKIPSYDEQQRIATILSRYDSLIENYQKQIKLLEESAQRLYKEWFIDLRFPGHENTKIVDGVPEGWEKKKLSDIANIIMGQSPKSMFYNSEKYGLPFHQGVGSYGFRFVVNNVYSTSFTRIAEPNSILFSVRAPVGRLNITKNKIVIGRGLASINHKKGCQSYLYYLLKEKFFKDNIIGNGAIFASISKEELYNQPFVIPSDEMIMRFDNIVNKIDKNIQYVDSQINHLTEARDRLLPKMMSGEVNVNC